MLKVVLHTGEQEGAIGPQTLDELALAGARQMLHHAHTVEVAAYLERHREERDERGPGGAQWEGPSAAGHVWGGDSHGPGPAGP